MACVAGVNGEGVRRETKIKTRGRRGRNACYKNRIFRTTPTNFDAIRFRQLSITVNRFTNQKLARTRGVLIIFVFVYLRWKFCHYSAISNATGDLQVSKKLETPAKLRRRRRKYGWGRRILKKCKKTKEAASGDVALMDLICMQFGIGGKFI